MDDNVDMSKKTNESTNLTLDSMSAHIFRDINVLLSSTSVQEVGSSYQ